MSYNYGNYGAASGYTSGGYAATSGYSNGGYAATSGYSTGGYAAASGASGYASGSGYSASGYGNGSHVNGYSTSTYNSSPAHSATATTTTSSYNNNTTSSYKAPSSTSAYQSQIERQIVDAKQPITYNTRETTTAGQWSGLWLNKQEVDSFRGPIAITEYKINQDSNPEVIRKRLDKVKYTQEVQVKYLQPGPGPKPGDIIIRERQSSVPPAPPVIIRQEAKGASDPAPLVLRGRPPRAQQIPPIEVEIDGPPAPPLPRRVIVEKLSSLPAKPQNVIVEKWLPYTQQKRRVIYEKAHQQGVSQVRNLIIEWEAPEVEINKVCKNLGTIQADPEEYLRKYGHELKDDSELPDCGDAPQGQCGVGGSVRRATTGASATTDDLPELEGDIQALKLVNLEKYGLGAYRRYIQ